MLFEVQPIWWAYDSTKASAKTDNVVKLDVGTSNFSSHPVKNVRLEFFSNVDPGFEVIKMVRNLGSVKRIKATNSSVSPECETNHIRSS